MTTTSTTTAEPCTCGSMYIVAGAGNNTLRSDETPRLRCIGFSSISSRLNSGSPQGSNIEFMHNQDIFLESGQVFKTISTRPVSSDPFYELNFIGSFDNENYYNQYKIHINNRIKIVLRRHDNNKVVAVKYIGSKSESLELNYITMHTCGLGFRSDGDFYLIAEFYSLCEADKNDCCNRMPDFSLVPIIEELCIFTTTTTPPPPPPPTTSTTSTSTSTTSTSTTSTSTTSTSTTTTTPTPTTTAAPTTTEEPPPPGSVVWWCYCCQPDGSCADQDYWNTTYPPEGVDAWCKQQFPDSCGEGRCEGVDCTTTTTTTQEPTTTTSTTSLPTTSTSTSTSTSTTTGTSTSPSPTVSPPLTTDIGTTSAGTTSAGTTSDGATTTLPGSPPLPPGNGDCPIGYTLTPIGCCPDTFYACSALNLCLPLDRPCITPEPFGDFASISELSDDQSYIGEGVGTELKKLLKFIGITASKDCSCNARAKTMNEKGIEWCKDNIDTIVGWLKEEASKRNLPFFAYAARKLVQLAIGRAEKGKQ
jgi:hypothetical protein